MHTNHMHSHSAIISYTLRTITRHVLHIRIVPYTLCIIIRQVRNLRPQVRWVVRLDSRGTSRSDSRSLVVVYLCKCNIAGSVQVTLQPWAIFFVCLYTLGFPLFLAIVIYRNYDLIIEDQILRAHNLQVTGRIDLTGRECNVLD